MPRCTIAPSLLDTLFVRYVRSVDHPCKLRFANWLGRNAFSRIVACTDSGQMILDWRDLIQRALLLYGVFEPETTALHRRILASGMVYVDIGANVGAFTLLASKLVGSAGKVIAIEPNPAIFSRLLENLALNPQCANVRPFLCACSDTDGFAYLKTPPIANSGVARISPNGGSGSFMVPTKPAADIIARVEVDAIDLLKIDVEGHEAHVLESLLASGMRPRNVICEYLPDDFSDHSILPELFETYGYSLSLVTGQPYNSGAAYDNNLWAHLESS